MASILSVGISQRGIPANSSKRPWQQCFVILLLLLFMLPAPLQATPLMTDVELRIALLYNFMRFTEWPEDVLGPNGTPVTVCIARGDTEMQEGLMILEQRTIKERPIVIQQIQTPRDIGACHVLYLPRAEQKRVSDFLEAAESGSGGILTVSDGAGFVDANGMIGLKLIENRYQFEVNNDAVRRAKLRLHPQLLSLASRVLLDDNQPLRPRKFPLLQPKGLLACLKYAKFSEVQGFVKHEYGMESNV